MKRVNGFSIIAAAVALLVVAVGPAAAIPVAEPLGQYAGHYTYDMGTGITTFDGFTTRLPGDLYNNTNPAAPANFGFSSTALNSTFGDRVNTVAVGLLGEQDLTFFNSTSGGNTNAYQTASFNMSFLDGVTNAPLGAYTTGVVNFGVGGLPAGFFSIITIQGILPSSINLSTLDVQVRQQLATSTLVPGGAGVPRTGIASLDPPTIGSSANTMYIDSSTVGPAGYYNIGNPPLNANPGYRLSTVPEPGTLALLGLGVAALIRRRRA